MRVLAAASIVVAAAAGGYAIGAATGATAHEATEQSSAAEKSAFNSTYARSRSAALARGHSQGEASGRARGAKAGARLGEEAGMSDLKAQSAKATTQSCGSGLVFVKPFLSLGFRGGCVAVEGTPEFEKCVAGGGKWGQLGDAEPGIVPGRPTCIPKP